MTERVFAVIDNAIVSNTIVADEQFASLIRPEHEDVIEVTDMTPRPGIGWGYDGSEFVNPSPPETDNDGTVSR
jgi:hypothetical protein